MKSNYRPIPIPYVHPEAYTQEIFDPVQSHAVYGLVDETVNRVKEHLVSKGATRFRLRKLKNGFRILCYRGLSK